MGNSGRLPPGESQLRQSRAIQSELIPELVVHAVFSCDHSYTTGCEDCKNALLRHMDMGSLTCAHIWRPGHAPKTFAQRVDSEAYNSRKTIPHCWT